MSELSCSSLSRPGCEVYYGHRPSESGRWAVFFHGAGMDNHMFDSQYAALPPDMGIASWDARGHGRSQLKGRFRYTDMLADARALIDELGAQDLTIIGQSMGGNLAQSLADDAPPALKRLVLIDCTDPWAAWQGRTARSAILGVSPESNAVELHRRAIGQGLRMSGRNCRLRPRPPAGHEKGPFH